MREWLAIAALVLVLDQISKAFVIMILGFNTKLVFMPSLNFTLAYNRGAAFGFLAESNGWQKWLFCGIALVFSSCILIWSARLTDRDYWEGVALAGILGGAIGNLIDRLRYGYVIDFIDFYIGDWHWYTFNVADIAICVGAAILILLSFRTSSKSTS